MASVFMVPGAGCAARSAFTLKCSAQYADTLADISVGVGLLQTGRYSRRHFNASYFVYAGD